MEEANKVEVAPGVTVPSLETFWSRVDWTDARTPQAASAVPVEKPGNPESTVLSMLRLWMQMRDSCNPGGYRWLAAGDIPNPLY